MITTPADALNRHGIVAGAPLAPQRVEVALFSGTEDMRTCYPFGASEEMRAYDQALPYGAQPIPAPSRHQDLRTPTTIAEQEAWSSEAEAEARRRGWQTSRRPDGLRSVCFDCWLPVGE